MKKLLLLFSIFLIIACTSQNVIPNSSEVLNKGGKIDIVSFYKDNPKYIVYYDLKMRAFYVNLIKADKKNSDKKGSINKPKNSQSLSQLGGRPISIKKGSSKVEYKDEYTIKARSMLERFNINNYLMKHFILKFKQRESNITLGFNLDASKRVAPFVKHSSISSDRDFANIKDSLNSNLVLELRILKLLIEEDEQRFLSTWNITMVAKGILYNLDTNTRLWESSPIEYQLETPTFSSFKESRKKSLQENFEDLSEKIADKLVDAFFDK